MTSKVLKTLLLATLVVPAFAQEPEPPPPQPITEEVRAELESARAAVEKRRERIAFFEEQLITAPELRKPLLETRLDLAWVKLLQAGVNFAEKAAGYADEYDMEGTGATVKEFKDFFLQQGAVGPEPSSNEG